MTHVLLVDDDPDIRLLLRTMLVRAGFMVTETPGGHEALAYLADARPDVVILDVQMPQMDGWETLARIRSDLSMAGLPVLLCTVKARPGDMLKGWRMACDGYVTKPFDNRDLVTEIKAAATRTAEERAKIQRSGIAEAVRRVSLDA